MPKWNHIKAILHLDGCEECGFCIKGVSNLSTICPYRRYISLPHFSCLLYARYHVSKWRKNTGCIDMDILEFRTCRANQPRTAFVAVLGINIKRKEQTWECCFYCDSDWLGCCLLDPCAYTYVWLDKSCELVSGTMGKSKDEGRLHLLRTGR